MPRYVQVRCSTPGCDNLVRYVELKTFDEKPPQDEKCDTCRIRERQERRDRPRWDDDNW